MNKQEFLDILKDYLSDHFSLYDLNDILRDYEEYFLNGAIEGKSEEEVAKVLGSPKAIAEALIHEMKIETEKTDKGTSIKDTLVYAKVKDFLGNLLENSSTLVKKLKESINNRLPSDFEINGSPRWLQKFFLLILTAILMIPAFFIVGGALFGGFLLILATLGTIAAYPISLISGQIDGSFIGLGISLSVLATGLLIIFWLIYRGVLRLIKIGVIKYVSWLKTRFMYMRVRNQTKLIPELGLEGGDLHENQ